VVVAKAMSETLGLHVLKGKGDGALRGTAPRDDGAMIRGTVKKKQAGKVAAASRPTTFSSSSRDSASTVSHSDSGIKRSRAGHIGRRSPLGEKIVPIVTTPSHSFSKHVEPIRESSAELADDVVEALHAAEPNDASAVDPAGLVDIAH
jgi:hypothetical protein